MYAWRSNQYIELTPPEYNVVGVDGLSKSVANLMAQKAPYQNGTNLIDSSLEERNCSIELVVKGQNRKELQERKRKLINAFSPAHGLAELIYTDPEGDNYVLEAIVDEGPNMPRRAKNIIHQPAVINLMAPDPTWRSEELTTMELDTSESARINVKHFGDVNTPVQMTIKGACENPKIKNLSTAEGIYIDGFSLLADEKIEIDTKFMQKSVVHYDENNNRSNIFSYVETGSVLFYLQPGNNQIDVRADVGDPVVEFEFYERYGGV